MDGLGHLLSLKVMRVSRPGLSNAWEPFYSSSPSFSARSTASMLSLQGKDPLPGHPRTLRDLSHATELLLLPSAFGAIQLGQTFSSCVCVNNDSTVDIEGVSLRVEMQTATSKVVLVDLGGSTHKLSAGDTLETIASHEIKELGQHVLACMVSYRLPPNARRVPGSEDANDPSLETFRKFYKFAATNPLSVKTKVHVPRSPFALLSPTEREKVFLEIHIQNLTPEALWFERVGFLCVDGWTVTDVNVIDPAQDQAESLFSDTTALMQPQDIRQYIYIINPILPSVFPSQNAPGTIIPLGRLDISWKSSYGEPGRLLTSTLSRKVNLPPPPPQPPASALPLHMQRGSVAASQGRPVSSGPSRPATPPISQSAIPNRPGSPFRHQPRVSRPQSPSLSQLVLGPAGPAAAQTRSTTPSRPQLEIEVDIIVKEWPEDVRIEKPFEVSFKMTISAAVPRGRKRRYLTLAVQSLQLPPIEPPSDPLSLKETFTPRLPSSGFSTPSAAQRRDTFNYVLAEQKLLSVTPRKQNTAWTHEFGGKTLNLPAPYHRAEEGKYLRPRGIVVQGVSVILLEQIQLSSPAEADHDIQPQDGSIPGAQQTGEDTAKRVFAVQEFQLFYVPLQKGVVTAGGLRVLLVEDKLQDEDEDQTLDESNQEQTEVRMLKELDSIGEFWVRA